MTATDAQRRFADATTRHLTAPITDGVTLHHVDSPTWHAAVDPIWAAARSGTDLRALFTADEAGRIADLDAILAVALEHRVLLERDGDVIGGYWGAQDTIGRYCMVVSIVRDDARRHGLYSALLARVVDAARDSGFREVYSRHRADNNAILVPKLRAGFVIAGFEIMPRFGLTIILRKYLVENVRLMHEHRIDGANADELRKRGLHLP